MGTVAWLTSTHEWEPLIGTIALFGTLLGLEISDLNKSRKLCETDTSLFQTLQNDLPHNSPGITLLKDQDLGAPFRSSNLNDLYEFINMWGNATHEFRNKTINNKLAEFYSELNKFLNQLSLNVYAANTEGFLTMDLEDFETRDYKIEAKDKLNKMASNVHALYEVLIKEINKKI